MPDAPGILRVFRARVKPGNEDEWELLLDKQIRDQLVGVDGLLRWYRGKPIESVTDDYTVVTIWRDMDAMRAFAGASGRPVLSADQTDLELSTLVQFYELW